LNVLEKPITVCTVVQNCCKGDSPCQWNVPILDHQEPETPELIDTKLDRDLTPHDHFGIPALKKGVAGSCTYACNCHHPCLSPRYFFIPCASAEIAPFDRMSCFMAQTTCFVDIYVLFGV